MEKMILFSYKGETRMKSIKLMVGCLLILGFVWAVAMATGPAAAQQAPLPIQQVKGPRVFLDYDQAELDAAYDQSAWVPNLPQLLKRYETNSEAVRARLGAPRRFSYGPTPIEALDVYPTRRPNAPIHIHIHGGAWRALLAKDFGFAAELFVNARAHYVVPDFAWVQDAGGSLMVMADQVRRAIAWTQRNAASFGGDPNRIYVSGWSSGAHLAGVSLTTDWQHDFGLPPDTIKGGLLSSGMFDLRGPRLSARRLYVKFDDATEEDPILSSFKNDQVALLFDSFLETAIYDQASSCLTSASDSSRGPGLLCEDPPIQEVVL